MKHSYLLLMILFLSCVRPSAQVTMTTRVVKSGLFIPWEIIYGPDNNIWMTQKNGYICRLHIASGQLDTLYHETAVAIKSEGGMLGMALHPDFPVQPYLYVMYDYLNGTSYQERLVRYTYNGTNALTSPLTLFDNINANNFHNGSRLVIVGDKLFFSCGEATVQPDAQNLQSPNGKIHRINLDGSIPADNPLPGSSIWSWGHRNPQGLVYANGILYSSEHGPNNDDEVNIIRKGRNYGWPVVMGFCDQPSELTFCTDSNVVEPLRAWTPTLAVCGIDYYVHPMFPALQGSLLMATLKDQHLYQMKLNTAKDSIVSVSIIDSAKFGRLRDVCISPAGRIYISTSNSNAAGTSTFIDKIIELSDPNATGIPAPAPSPLRLYPNPVHGVLVAEYPGNKDAGYRILDGGGKVVASGRLEGALVHIPVQQLASGYYHMQVQGKDGSQVVQSFVKTE